MEEKEEKDKFEKEANELKTLYDKATTKEQYQKVIDGSGELDDKMKEANKTMEEIGKATQYGFWADYYLKMKFEPGSSNNDLCRVVGSYYNCYKTVNDSEGAIQYGYLLANIKSKLRGENSEAKAINSEIKILAKESGNIAFILKTINSAGNKEMNEKKYDEAVKIFNEIEDFDKIPKDAFRYAGHILNQRGISKIRGDIDVFNGIEDMLLALRKYYLQERPLPWKHIEGIVDRLNEAGKKLTEQAKKLEQSS